MATLKRFTPEWWLNREVSVEWCDRFCKPFYEEDPTLKSNPKTHESIGTIFYNTPHGDIIPVGITALQGEDFIFQYHPAYLTNSKLPAIAETLPKRKERYVRHGEMLSFFDNLPAEGWFGKAQGAALGDDNCLRNGDPKSFHMDRESLDKRYHRFMMFGRDYPGAVWGTYIRIDPHVAEEHHQETVRAALESRSSISGMQPKLLGVKDKNGRLRPAGFWETSTHIVKLRPVTNTDSGHSEAPMLLQYEYMANVASKVLLPNDEITDATLTHLYLKDGTKREVLAIRRFDRTEYMDGKIHFEEINQILNRQNKNRYRDESRAGLYEDIANAVRDRVGNEGVKQFYARLLCQFLVGNFDNHFKNFALIHDREGGRWKLSPDYDLAPSIQVTDDHNKKGTALKLVRGKNDKELFSTTGTDDIDLKMLVTMGQEFGLSLSEIRDTIRSLIANIPRAKASVIADQSALLDDHFAPMDSGSRRWYIKSRVDGATLEQKTCKQDFCDRIDGRAAQLFAGMEKYISILEKKERTKEANHDR